MTEVSIIMGARGREYSTRRTLQSYTKLSYHDYELLFMDVVIENYNSKHLYEEFKDKLPIQYLSQEENRTDVYDPNKTWTPATTWNYGMKNCSGKFIIVCSADLLITYPDLIEKYLEQYKANRISVLTYFLTKQMTESLDTMDWNTNPEMVKSLSGFWDTPIDGDKNIDRRLAGLTTYMTGQPREMWDYVGRFRTELSHLVNDQDLVLRDLCLGRGVDTLEDYYCYHQSHMANSLSPEQDQHVHSVISPGWNYHNEAQARLLEPAPRDPH